MPLQRIALIGANGTLGPSILQALLAPSTFSITVVSRKNSKSTYPSTVKVIYASDDPSLSELVSLLQGQDALITTFAGSNSALQIRLADAAAQAGVKRFIPADFGSCDSRNPRARELLSLYREKTAVREHLERLAAEGKLTWTSIVCGHFFDYGLKTGLLQIDLKARKARVFDGSGGKWSASTLARVGEATVRVLEPQREEATANRVLLVQSFCVSQKEVLGLLEKVVEGKWEVEHVGSENFIEEMKGTVDKDPSNGEAKENLVGVVGLTLSNWEGKEDFANRMLELEDEDLEEVVKKVVNG
ncbi:MAG: hypothetical protein Q9160_003433 [Pyrenula sp. 1 TL-2023]